MDVMRCHGGTLLSSPGVEENFFSGEGEAFPPGLHLDCTVKHPTQECWRRHHFSPWPFTSPVGSHGKSTSKQRGWPSRFAWVSTHWLKKLHISERVVWRNLPAPPWLCLAEKADDQKNHISKLELCFHSVFCMRLNPVVDFTLGWFQ